MNAQAEKLNIEFVNAKVGVGLLTKEEYKKYEQDKEAKKDLLKIPRRYVCLFHLALSTIGG